MDKTIIASMIFGGVLGVIEPRIFFACMALVGVAFGMEWIKL